MRRTAVASSSCRLPPLSRKPSATSKKSCSHRHQAAAAMYSFVGGCRDQPAAAAHFWPSQLLSPDFLAGTAQTVGNRIAKEKPVHAALCGNLHQAFVPLGERVLGVMPSSSNFGVGV